MAKYTELFADYLKYGGELPATFENIEGFADLFSGYYADKEIGFETENLFQIKLETYAEIYVPIYRDRIARLAVAWTQAGTPVKIHYETSDGNITYGAQHTEETELPFGGGATPSSTNDSNAYTNSDGRNIMRQEKGVTVDEAYRVIEKLNEKVKPLVKELLDAFAPCFMRVY